MTNRKAITGEIMTSDEELPSLEQAEMGGNPRSIMGALHRRIQIYNDRLIAQGEVVIARAQNELGDEMVRAGEITIALKELDAKLDNLDSIREGVTATVRAGTQEAQNRLAAAQHEADIRELKQQIERLELERKLERLKNPPKPKREQSPKEKLRELEKELLELIAQYDEATAAAGGELDEARARHYDTKIGSLHNRISILLDEMGE